MLITHPLLSSALDIFTRLIVQQPHRGHFTGTKSKTQRGGGNSLKLVCSQPGCEFIKFGCRICPHNFMQYSPSVYKLRKLTEQQSTGLRPPVLSLVATFSSPRTTPRKPVTSQRMMVSQDQGRGAASGWDRLCGHFTERHDLGPRPSSAPGHG